MTALFRIALLIWVATFCLSAQAQKPGADVRVRIHAREALNTFYQSGAVELRRMSEFCYASNFAAPQTPISNNDVPKNLALERCVTYDSVGLILYTLQKRMMETQFNKPFNEPYFNQEDEQERQNILPLQ